MTQKELTRRIFVLERERDGLRAENCRLRDKLLSYARECLTCDGTGVITRNERQSECLDCLDIREILA